MYDPQSAKNVEKSASLISFLMIVLEVPETAKYKIVLFDSVSQVS